MTISIRLALVACATLVAGCNHVSSIKQELPPKVIPSATVTEAVATLHTVTGHAAVGRVELSTDNLVSALDAPLRNLPPGKTLHLTVRPRRGTTAADAGPVTDLRGTSDTGILATVTVDQAGNGTLVNDTTVVYFLYDNLIGHNLTLADENGELVATGILGIAATK